MTNIMTRHQLLIFTSGQADKCKVCSAQSESRHGAISNRDCIKADSVYGSTPVKPSISSAKSQSVISWLVCDNSLGTVSLCCNRNHRCGSGKNGLRQGLRRRCYNLPKYCQHLRQSLLPDVLIIHSIICLREAASVPCTLFSFPEIIEIIVTVHATPDQFSWVCLGHTRRRCQEQHETHWHETAYAHTHARFPPNSTSIAPHRHTHTRDRNNGYATYKHH